MLEGYAYADFLNLARKVMEADPGTADRDDEGRNCNLYSVVVTAVMAVMSSPSSI